MLLTLADLVVLLVPSDLPRPPFPPFPPFAVIRAVFGVISFLTFILKSVDQIFVS